MIVSGTRGIPDTPNVGSFPLIESCNRTPPVRIKDTRDAYDRDTVETNSDKVWGT